MKRFITYLYEYEKGQKTKNTGFIRVDERNGRVVFQISVRNFIHSRETGEIYAYIWENGLLGIEIGKLMILNNQTETRIEMDAGNLRETGYGIESVVGMGFVFPNNGYMASCWDDNYGEMIGGGRFRKWEDGSDVRRVQEQEKDVPDFQTSELTLQEKKKEEMKDAKESEAESVRKEELYELITYQKMELNAIKNLPSPNWYLCNNRFLVHGFFNYGYLILKKTTETDGEKTYLGVPGVYEKPEMVMATLFGFSKFQTLPQEVSEAKMEEVISVPGNTQRTTAKSSVASGEKGEPKQGIFGCWLIPIQGEIK